ILLRSHSPLFPYTPLFRSWLRAAAVLGCHAIRVNAEGQGAPAEQSRLVADGLHQLAQAAEPYQLHVLVENHGGLSSQPSWLMARSEEHTSELQSREKLVCR